MWANPSRSLFMRVNSLGVCYISDGNGFLCSCGTTQRLPGYSSFSEGKAQDYKGNC